MVDARTNQMLHNTSAARRHALRTLLLVSAVLACLVLPAAVRAEVPNFTLTSPAEGERVGSSMTVYGYSTNVDISATCRLSDNSPGPEVILCNYGYSPKTVSVSMNVFGPDGPRTLTVTVIAQDGSHEARIVTRNVIVDRTGPSVWTTSGPSSGSWGNGNLIWTFESSEPGTFSCRIDEEDPVENCTSPFTAGTLAEGEHVLRISGEDDLGNKGPEHLVNFSVNDSAPEVSFSSVGDKPFQPGVTNLLSTPDVAFVFVTNRRDSSFECRLDDGFWEPCSWQSWTKSGLADGTHTMDVRAFMPGPTSVQDPPSRATFVIDTVKPNMTVDVPVHNAGTTVAIDWSSDKVLVESNCQLDGVTYSPCPKTFSDLDGGEHSYVITGTDNAGNVSDPVTRQFWTYPDLPETSFTSGQPPAAPVAAATFTFFSSTPGSSFECSFDGAAWSPCASPATFSTDHLSAGPHVVEARAVDPAGQTDPTPIAWVFTLAAPAVGETPGSTGAPSAGGAAPRVTSISGKAKKLSMKVNRAGTISVLVQTCQKTKKHGRTKTVCKKFTTAKATAKASGKLVVKLKKKLVKKRQYKLTVTSRGSGGGATVKTTKTIRAK